MRLEAATPARSRVGLTPLIDVVFLLLVFFILAGRFETDSLRPLDLAAPAPSSAPAGPAPPTVLLALDPAGRPRLNGEPLAPAEVDARLQALLRDRPGLQVALDPDPELSLQGLIDWLDRLEGIGVARTRLLAGGS
ncbi:MAG: biopolymer transporter ExbD [Geminicoccaceae bacterium]|nr:biopolymer transporter ExbD [Geminicoccaceae bacterium]